jgi:hypothetical protein
MKLVPTFLQSTIKLENSPPPSKGSGVVFLVTSPLLGEKAGNLSVDKKESRNARGNPEPLATIHLMRIAGKYALWLEGYD